jgi:hypothetical protein
MRKLILAFFVSFGFWGALTVRYFTAAALFIFMSSAFPNEAAADVVYSAQYETIGSGNSISSSNSTTLYVSGSCVNVGCGGFGVHLTIDSASGPPYDGGGVDWLGYHYISDRHR